MLDKDELLLKQHILTFLKTTPKEAKKLRVRHNNVQSDARNALSLPILGVHEAEEADLRDLWFGYGAFERVLLKPSSSSATHCRTPRKPQNPSFESVSFESEKLLLRWSQRVAVARLNGFLTNSFTGRREDDVGELWDLRQETQAHSSAPRGKFLSLSLPPQQ
jgi:hypothetical protein